MYSEPIKRMLMRPVNGRRGDHYNGEGICESEVCCRTNPRRKIKTRARFRVLIENGVVLEARWDAFGDPVALAVASWCVQQVVGHEVDDLAHQISPEKASMALNITNELDIRAGCSTVIKSLVSAFNDYQTKLGADGS